MSHLPVSIEMLGDKQKALVTYKTCIFVHKSITSDSSDLGLLALVDWGGLLILFGLSLRSETHLLHLGRLSSVSCPSIQQVSLGSSYGKGREPRGRIEAPRPLET